MHLQSLCGLLNVPPLLHMNTKFCGGGHRWLWQEMQGREQQEEG